MNQVTPFIPVITDHIMNHDPILELITVSGSSGWGLDAYELVSYTQDASTHVTSLCLHMQLSAECKSSGFNNLFGQLKAEVSVDPESQSMSVDSLIWTHLETELDRSAQATRGEGAQR